MDELDILPGTRLGTGTQATVPHSSAVFSCQVCIRSGTQAESTAAGRLEQYMMQASPQASPQANLIAAGVDGRWCETGGRLGVPPRREGSLELEHPGPYEGRSRSSVSPLPS